MNKEKNIHNSLLKSKIKIRKKGQDLIKDNDARYK